MRPGLSEGNLPLAPVEPGGKSERWWGEWGIGWLLVVLVCCGRLRYLARARVQQAWRVAVCTLHFPHRVPLRVPLVSPDLLHHHPLPWSDQVEYFW